ncbi:MAG TPA: hypothetical protein VFI28_12720 [Candidatus Limnocylindrales bacterium]|nr:hypothetical protein [Candidatus Limnocylindrales bacterium]
MASPRTIALGLAVGTIFAGYLALWLHFVAFVALALGASALVLILVLAAAFGEDAEEAERAWRAAAGSIAGRTPGERSSDEPSTWQQPRPRDDGHASPGADPRVTGAAKPDANGG